MENEEWDVLREDLMDTYLLLGIITVVIYSIAFYFVFHSIIAIFLIITFWIVTIVPILYGLEKDDKKIIAGGVILSIFFGYFFISSGMSSNQPVYLRIFAFIYFNQFWLAPLITLILRAKGVKISLKAMGERDIYHGSVSSRSEFQQKLRDADVEVKDFIRKIGDIPDARYGITIFSASFSSTSYALEVLKELSFVDEDTQGLLIPEGIEIGVFRSTEGASVIIGGAISPEERVEIFELLKKKGRVEAIMVPK